MSNFTQTLCILFALTLVSLFSSATASRPHPPSQAPTPQKPPSCDTLMFKMINCLPYLKKRSSMVKPVTSCCSGVKDVWKVDSKCVYEALKSNVELGFDMNMTRVAHVTSTCGFMHGSMDIYSLSLLEGRQSIQSTGRSSTTPMALSPKSGDAESSSQHSSHSQSWYFLPVVLFALLLATIQQHQQQQQQQH